MYSYKRFEVIYECSDCKGDLTDEQYKPFTEILKYKPKQKNACPVCSGTRFWQIVKEYVPTTVCDNCAGSGQEQDIFSSEPKLIDCYKCKGSGKLEK